MKIAPRACLALMSAVSAAACGHSAPFLTDSVLEDQPLHETPPIQLTYSLGDDGWPTVSPDGKWLTYRFERGSTDRDFCAGAIPTTGGQRVAEVCSWASNDASRSDDFRALALLEGNRWAFTWHGSGLGNQAPGVGALYVGEVGKPHEARKVLDLLAAVPGGSANWSYLVDPIETAELEILTLASSAFIGQMIPFGPVDTVYQGVEIARIDLSTSPATVTSVVPAPNAVAWAFDRDTDLLYYQRRYYSAPPGSGASDVVADTIFQVPVTGGAPVALFGAPPVPAGSFEAGMPGFTILDDRLFVSLYSSRDLEGPPAGRVETATRVLEVGPDGSTREWHSFLSSSGDRWGRLAAVPGTRRLVAEGMIAGAKDLYLLEVEP